MSVQSSRRHVPRARAASCRARISAWAVGSWRASRSLWRWAMTTPWCSTTAPTGTSPCTSAASASTRATSIAATSSTVAVVGSMAEGVGFEPTVSCPTHALQACRFVRSRIPPDTAALGETGCRRGSSRVADGYPGPCPSGEVAVGSCATTAREPGQGREAAAFSGTCRVPQVAWPLPHPADIRPVAPPGIPQGLVVDPFHRPPTPGPEEPPQAPLSPGTPRHPRTSRARPRRPIRAVSRHQRLPCGGHRLPSGGQHAS